MERYSAPRGHACMAASLLARKLYKTSPGTKKSGSPGPAGSCQFTRFPKDITSQVPSLEAFQNRCMHFIPVQWHFFLLRSPSCGIVAGRTLGQESTTDYGTSDVFSIELLDCWHQHKKPCHPLWAGHCHALCSWRRCGTLQTYTKLNLDWHEKWVPLSPKRLHQFRQQEQDSRQCC